MRVSMLSKACIVGIYQRKLEAIARQGVELTALVPPSWQDERGEQALERSYTEGYRLRTIPIRFNGSYHLHHYPTLGAQLRAARPDIVHIDEEPYNLATWQALYQARRLMPNPCFLAGRISSAVIRRLSTGGKPGSFGRSIMRWQGRKMPPM